MEKQESKQDELLRERYNYICEANKYRQIALDCRPAPYNFGPCEVARIFTLEKIEYYDRAESCESYVRHLTKKLKEQGVEIKEPKKDWRGFYKLE